MVLWLASPLLVVKDPKMIRVKTKRFLFANFTALPWFWLLLIFDLLFVSKAWAQYSIIQVGRGLVNAQSIAISGQYAYVAADAGGLRVFDISNPTSPVQIGSKTNIQDFAFSIAARGNYVFATGNPNLQVYDVSTPNSPFKISSVSGGNFGGAKVIDVFGDTAFVCDGQILNTYDVSSLVSPKLLQTTNTQQHIKILNVASNLAYVSSFTGFGALEVSDPTNCNYAFFTNFLSPGENFVSGTVSRNGIAYVGESKKGLSIFDISNPPSVNFLKRTNLVSSIDGLAMAGSYLLISGIRFSLYDLSDSTNPVEIGRSATRSNRGISSFAPRLVVQSNFIYTAEGAFGLNIFSIFPILGISTSSSNTAFLTWSLPLAGEAYLQECSNISVPAWTSVTNTPTIASNRVKVELPLGGGSKYYRLQLK